MKNNLRGVKRSRIDLQLVTWRQSVLARALSILYCLLLLTSCQAAKPGKGLEVKVARVVSGQTLEVTGIGDQPALISQVRLIGIDAPDLRQNPWGEEAKTNLEQMISNKPVWLEFDVQDKDDFGRYLSYVWLDGVLLNEELIEQGYGLAVARSPNQKYEQQFFRAQESARLIGQGIWNPEKPMRLTPTEFRLQNR